MFRNMNELHTVNEKTKKQNTQLRNEAYHSITEQLVFLISLNAVPNEVILELYPAVWSKIAIN